MMLFVGSLVLLLHAVRVLLVFVVSRWNITALSISQVLRHAVLQASCLLGDQLCLGSHHRSQACVAGQHRSLPLHVRPLPCLNASPLQSATMNLCCLLARLELVKHRPSSTSQSLCVSVSSLFSDRQWMKCVS